MSEKIVIRIGWFASIMAILMYFSYLDQIRLNLGGQPGSLFLPLATCVNCASWASYAFFKTPRDWPIILPNLLGIFLAAVTVITALI